MQKLLAVIIVVALAWSGYWYWSAKSREKAIAGWIADRAADGWIASTGDISVRGFPNRVDAILTGLELADPQAGWAWSAERFEILSLSYKPHHIIAVWPGEQVIGTPFETLRLNSGNFRGSVVFEPNASLAPDRLTLELDSVTLTASMGDAGGIGDAVFAIRQTEGADPGTYDIALDASNLRPPHGWLPAGSLTDSLPARVSNIRLDTEVTFDRKWNQESIETDMPEISTVRIRDMSATWGVMNIRAKGDLKADANGLAEGEIRLRARNWEEMLDVAVASGAITPGLAGPLKSGLGLIATLSGNAGGLQVPLRFKNGTARLGPVRIGRAPRLWRVGPL